MVASHSISPNVILAMGASSDGCSLDPSYYGARLTARLATVRSGARLTAELLEPYPKLRAIAKRVYSLPALKDYYQMRASEKALYKCFVV